MSSMITDFPSRSELIADFCSTDKKRRTELILSSEQIAEKLHKTVDEALSKIHQAAVNHKVDNHQDHSDDNNTTPNKKRINNNSTDQDEDDPFEASSEFTSPGDAGSSLVGRRTNPTKSLQDEKKQATTTVSKENQEQKRHQQLIDQQTALKHELETLRRQQYTKKLGIHYKCAEMSRLRKLSDNIIPRAHQVMTSSGVTKTVDEYKSNLEDSIVAARIREQELKDKLLMLSTAAAPNRSTTQKVASNSYKENSSSSVQKNKQKPVYSSSSTTTVLSLLEKTHAKLEQEKQSKLDLIHTFEKRIKEHKSVNNVGAEIKNDMKIMKKELRSLRDQERSLRHTLAADAVRRVLDARHKPLQLRGKSAHARLEEAMAFLKAEVVHFGHDVRPVSKALSSRDHQNLFKQAHNELKLIVGLMLPSGENAHAQFQRKQGQTWPLTAEALEDRFPPHKVDTAYVKLQEMVVAWDCLSRSSQEQLTTAQDVVNNAEVLLMFARHVGDLYAEKKSQMSERASKIASMSTGDHSASTTTGVMNHHSNSTNNSTTVPQHNHHVRRGSSVSSSTSAAAVVAANASSSSSHHRRQSSSSQSQHQGVTMMTSPTNNATISTPRQQQAQHQHQSGIPTTPSTRTKATTSNVMMTSPSTSAVASGGRRR